MPTKKPKKPDVHPLEPHRFPLRRRGGVAGEPRRPGSPEPAVPDKERKVPPPPKKDD